MTDPALLSALDAVYRSVAESYADRGGHHYFGYSRDGDHRNYLGPWAWSEADCVLRLAVELERELPGLVHCEMPLAKWTLADFDPSLDARQRVDLVVTDMTTLPSDDRAELRFRAWEHDLFLEAKHLKKQEHGPWARKLAEKVPDIQADLDRLNEHVRRERCRAAAMFLVDDGDYLARHGTGLEFGRVLELRLSPSALAALPPSGPAITAPTRQPEPSGARASRATEAIEHITGWTFEGVDPSALLNATAIAALDRVLDGLPAPDHEIVIALADAGDPQPLPALLARIPVSQPAALERWHGLTGRLAEARHELSAAPRVVRSLMHQDGLRRYYVPIAVRRHLQSRPPAAPSGS